MHRVEKRTGKPAALHIGTDLVDRFLGLNVKNRLESYFQMVRPSGALGWRCVLSDTAAAPASIIPIAAAELKGGGQTVRFCLPSASTSARRLTRRRRGREPERPRPRHASARSNYDTAAAIAKREALINSRFTSSRQGAGNLRRR